MTNEDLIEFRNSILQDVKLNSNVNMNYQKLEFLRYTTNILSDAEEFNDFQECHYEGTASHNRKFEIDGYAFDESDMTLYIVCCVYDGTSTPTIINQTIAQKYFDRVGVFINENDYIIKNGEESAAGYEFAIDMQTKLKSKYIRKIKIYLVCDGIASERIKTIKSKTVNDIGIEYHLWDISRFYKLQESTTGKEDIEINVEDYTNKGIPCIKANMQNANYDSYLCILPADFLVKIYDEFGGRLLEGNVRSFLSLKGKVNSGIKKTILTEPQMFFAYNNGIAATATDIEISNQNGGYYIKKIKALQIVNGGQTTASLSMTNMKEKDVDLDNILVPAKISILPLEKAPYIIPEISRCANSQNKVSEADFFSNHQFHIRFEQFSRNILAPAVNGAQYQTRWYYERARGQYTQEQMKLTPAMKAKFLLENPKKQLITKTDLAKYLNSYYQKPYEVSKGAQRNFLSFAEIITDDWEKHSANYNENYFKEAICHAIMFKKLEEIILEQPWYEKGYRANIVTYTMSKFFYVLQTKYPQFSYNFKYVWQHQELNPEIIKELTKLSELIYKSITSEDRQIVNVSEWCKKEACWKEIKSIDYEFDKNTLEVLVSKEFVDYDRKDAAYNQKLEDDCSFIMEVYNKGQEFWKTALIWGQEHRLLTFEESSIIKLAASGKILSDKQSKRAVDALNKLRVEGFSD